MGADSPPWRARVVGYGLVAALAVTVVVEAEPWPLSSFRLFSQVRTGQVVSWQLAIVTSDGTEVPVDLTTLPSELDGAHHQLPDLVGEPDADVLATVEPWVTAADVGGDVTAVRIYRTAQRVDDEGAGERRLVREVAR